MKPFWIALAFFITHSAYGLGPLLKYQYGNSVVSSELSIQLDGTIQRTEIRSGGSEAQAEVMLTPETRKKLFGAIQSVFEHPHTIVAAGPGTTHESRSGSLNAFSMNGPILIRTIERNQSGASETITYSDDPEARWIENLVYSLVRNRMDD